MGLPGLFGVGTAGVTDLLESDMMGSVVDFAGVDAVLGSRTQYCHVGTATAPSMKRVSMLCRGSESAESETETEPVSKTFGWPDTPDSTTRHHHVL